jgi:predicted acetyltransferase
MSLMLKWVEPDAYDRVAQTRMRCYSAVGSNLERYRTGLLNDRRNRPGDFLLASRDGVDVGTLASLSLHIHMRGGRIPCQGIAYVGTIKTHRRGGSDSEKGVASQMMSAALDLARQRGQAVSALMPFRASFYEHFGYGNAEQRVEWTIPISIIPRGEFAGYRFFEQSDRPACTQTRLVEARQGQCDIETSPEATDFWIDNYWNDGMPFVDQPTPGGPIEAYAMLLEDRGDKVATAVVEDWSCTSSASFGRMLHLLASLRDQYSFARITLPRDWPVNRMLKESQIPHRQVDHPVPTARPFTRMQIRIIDHKAALEAMKLSDHCNGRCVVAIKETEGHTSTIQVEVEKGHVRVGPATQAADVHVSDVMWASLVSGDTPASQLHRWERIKSTSASSIALLDAFSVGPAPFCQEYF